MHKIFSDNLSNKEKNLTTYLNLYSYMIARKNKAIFRNFNLLIDGIIFVWILKIFGFFRVQRNSFDMTSMAPKVFKDAILNNQTIYFIGTRATVIDKAIKNIQLEFPDLNICGYRDGYIKRKKERKHTIAKIKELNPDIVVCGMGTPLQEQFLVDLQAAGWKGRGYTCGGFLHQTANNIQYYPNWIDTFNLRGFYRMYDEPYLMRRYFFLYPWAFFKYILDSFRYNLLKIRQRYFKKKKQINQTTALLSSDNTKKRIVIMGTRGVPNHYGGFEQFAEYLSKRLANKGYEMFVYNSHNHPYQEKVWNKVHIIHCFDPEYIVGTIGQFIYDLNCICNIRKNNFDIVFQLGYTSSSIWNKFLPKESLLVTNTDGIEWRRSKYSLIVQRFLKYAERLSIKYSDYLVADSIGIQEYLKSRYNVESTYISYGAELINSPKVEVLKEFRLEQYAYDIVIARMEPENNIDMILDGFLKSNKFRDLVVVGSLDTRFGKQIFSKYNDKRIKYLGFVSGIEKLNSLRYFSNIYFHGHSVGGTNPSLLEAMSSNSLICAHDNIFNKSILEQDAFYFSESNNVCNLINSINKRSFKEIIVNNYNKIDKIYSWDKVADKYDKFFRQISF